MRASSLRSELAKYDSQLSKVVTESKNGDTMDILTPGELAILDPNDPMYERHREVLQYVKNHNPDLFKKMQSFE